MSTRSNSVTRFDNRVESYARHRPRYPQAVVACLQATYGLTPAMAIADIGAGTGLLSELFLRNGNLVYAVEPNATMRAKAETLLGDLAGFRSIDGRVGRDRTAGCQRRLDCRRPGLPLVRAGCDPGGVPAHPQAGRTGGPRLEQSARGRDALFAWLPGTLEEFGTDYRQVDHKFAVDATALTRFFAPGAWEKSSSSTRRCWIGRTGRSIDLYLLRAGAGGAGYDAMLARLEELFAANQQGIMIQYPRRRHVRGRGCRSPGRSSPIQRLLVDERGITPRRQGQKRASGLGVHGKLVVHLPVISANYSRRCLGSRARRATRAASAIPAVGLPAPA